MLITDTGAYNWGVQQNAVDIKLINMHLLFMLLFTCCSLQTLMDKPTQSC